MQLLFISRMLYYRRSQLDANCQLHPFLVETFCTFTPAQYGSTFIFLFAIECYRTCSMFILNMMITIDDNETNGPRK